MSVGNRWRWWWVAAVAMLAGCAMAPQRTPEQSVAELRSAELAFADTMARRDFAAFATFVAEDAVFVNGGRPLRGRAAVLDDWRRLFVSPQAPFSWRPDVVEVAGSGDLGCTEGPVTNAAGVVFARFYSTWRRGSGGRWQVVFDNGYAVGGGKSD